MNSTKPNGAKILVVDDAAPTVELLRRTLSGAGYKTFTAYDVPTAVRILGEEPVDLVITDVRMPEVSGMDLVRHVANNYPDVAVIVITGYASVAGAVEAVKTGAEEYLAKPFTPQELLAAVKGALAKTRARRQSAASAAAFEAARYGLVGDSPAMAKVYELIGKAAPVNVTVLITGESGTGKELVARAIHYAGPRAAAPFVAVNCGAIPRELLESELFGHVKGAFTGAVATRPGFFHAAEGGTIFLDEVSEMSPEMQVHLLRVLQEHEITMVGSRRPEKVDVRVIAATNKDLRARVAQGAFREDLYYRLDVLRIDLPPLRERGDDVLQLAAFFLAKYAQELNREPPRFADDVLAALTAYDWPGNVRELENLILRLVTTVTDDRIEIHHLPEHLRYRFQPQEDLRRPLAEVERDYIRRVLAAVGGNKTRAAKILGIDVKTLREKLKAGGPGGDDALAGE